MMKDLIQKFKMILFTKRCYACGEVVCFDEEFCENCAQLPIIDEPVCLKCGCSKKDCICRKFKREREYKSVAAPFYYEGSVAKGILNMKMNEMPGLSEFYGKAVADTVNRHFQVVDFDFVTFVPMRKADIAERGFNQSQLLAEIVSAQCGIPVKNVLYKKRKTKTQKKQKASERFANMYNAFEINADADIIGKKILLIDDVKTTGSTLTSVSLTLKAYGAECVYCAVAAIVK